MKYPSVFHGQGCQLCVGNQRTSHLAFHHGVPQDGPVAITWRHQPDIRLGNPSIHNSRSLFHGEAFDAQLRIRDHSEERRDRLPRETGWLAF